MSIETPAAEVDLVGLGGHYMDSHGPFIAKSNLFKATGIAEIDPTRRELARELFGLPETAVAANYEDLLEGSAAQAAVVTTGDANHYTSAELALRAGKSVLVEKPAAATLEECAELPALFDYADWRGLRYWICHPREFDKEGPWHAMAQLIRHPERIEGTFGVGPIGKLQQLEYSCFYTLPAKEKPGLHETFADDKMNHNVVSALLSLPEVDGFSDAVLLKVPDEKNIYDARMLTIPTGEHDEPIVVKMSGRRSARRENHPKGIYRDWVEATYQEGILRLEPTYGTITFTYGKEPRRPIEFNPRRLYDGMFSAINDEFARCVLDPDRPEPIPRRVKLLGSAAALLMKQPGFDGMVTEGAVRNLQS